MQSQKFIKVFIIASLFLQVGCSSARLEKGIPQEETFRFKKQEMDDALKLCWDATVNRIGGDNKEDEKIRKWQEAQSNSKEFWRNYSKKKTNAKEVWSDYSQRFFTTFWRDKANKYISYTLGIFSFGITLIPTGSKSYGYHEFDHPAYRDAIDYCEFKFENYKKAHGELDEEERKIVGSQDWLDERHSRFLEERKREEEKNKRHEAIELKKAKIEQKNQNLERQKRDDWAKSLGYGGGISEGIISTIRKITSGKLSFEEAGQYLIKKSPGDTFKVGNIIENYVIFQTFRNYDLVQIAVIKDSSETYIDGSILRGKHFAIIGRQQFTKILGGNTEILVLKRIK